MTRYGRWPPLPIGDDGNTLNYTETHIYDGNGNTGRCKVLEPDGNVLDDYLYEYDPLGRLIRSRQVSDGQTVLRTEHQYDTDNRMTGAELSDWRSDLLEAYTLLVEQRRRKDEEHENRQRANSTSPTTASSGSPAPPPKPVLPLHYQKAYGSRTISGNQTSTQISSLSYSWFYRRANLPLYLYRQRQCVKSRAGKYQMRRPPLHHDTQGQLVRRVPPWL
ncbi:MAG: hypothetical protein ACLU9S_22830 [Oscillospiraceae bacterium]